jgi:hypothetical protein
VRHKMQAIVHYCQAIPGVLGTVDQVGKTGSERDRCFMMGNGGVGDRAFVGMNRHRSEKALQGGLDACPTIIVGDVY